MYEGQEPAPTDSRPSPAPQAPITAGVTLPPSLLLLQGRAAAWGGPQLQNPWGAGDEALDSRPPLPRDGRGCPSRQLGRTHP